MRILPFQKKESRRERFEREAMPLMDSLYRFALSRTGDAAEADDLVQETYLKAWDAFDSYETGTNCRAWMCRILRNTHINRIRASSRETVTDEYPDGGTAQPLPGWSFFEGSSPEDASWIKFTRTEIQAAFERLPADFRSVVELADVEGFSYKEIADIMNTPIGTVMSRLYRGRRLMREMLVASGVVQDANPEVVESPRRGDEGGATEGSWGNVVSITQLRASNGGR